MKIFFKYIILLSFFFYSFFAIGQTREQEVNPNGYNKFYYENGKISSEGSMRDGRPDGYWKTYLPDGKMKSEGNRKNYELDSLWKFYDGNGKLITEINYAGGKKEGTKRNWDAKGYILLEENYAADVKQGITNTYYIPDDSTKTLGKLRMKTPFDKGKENGLAYEYDQNGNIITILDYSYGVLRRQEQINRIDKAGQKQGLWKDFYPSMDIVFHLLF